MAENFMEQNGMESMAHPPYSPDLAPSDFFLFQFVKKRLDQFECDDPDDLLEAITEILGSRQADDLHRVFQKWVGRVRVVAEGDGGSRPDETIHSYIAVGYLGSVGLAQRLVPRMILNSAHLLNDSSPCCEKVGTKLTKQSLSNLLKSFS
jgi:hypothetical protein